MMSAILLNRCSSNFCTPSPTAVLMLRKKSPLVIWSIMVVMTLIILSIISATTPLNPSLLLPIASMIERIAAMIPPVLLIPFRPVAAFPPMALITFTRPSAKPRKVPFVISLMALPKSVMAFSAADVLLIRFPWVIITLPSASFTTLPVLSLSL